MNQLIAICAVVVGAFAFILMMDVGSGSSNVDFATATLEEKQDWLNARAEKMGKMARFFLPSGGGPMNLSMSLKEVVTSPRADRMELIIDVKVPYGKEVMVTGSRSSFLDKFCKNYVKLGFYKNKVNLVVSFRNRKNGDPITRLSVSPHDCQWHAKKMQRT